MLFTTKLYLKSWKFGSPKFFFFSIYCLKIERILDIEFLSFTSGLYCDIISASFKIDFKFF